MSATGFGLTRVFCVSCGIELTTDNPLNAAADTIIFHVLAKHEVKLLEQLTEENLEFLKRIMPTLHLPSI
jgi:hypothetical protein